MEKPHESKRCLFVPNKERNKKPSQMPILIVSKWWFYLLACLISFFLSAYLLTYLPISLGLSTLTKTIFIYGAPTFMSFHYVSLTPNTRKQQAIEAAWKSQLEAGAPGEDGYWHLHFCFGSLLPYHPSSAPHIQTRLWLTMPKTFPLPLLHFSRKIKSYINMAI